MADTHIAELKTEDEREAAFPVLMELWTDAPRQFTRRSFVEFLHELREFEGYRLFGLFVNETLVTLAGVSIRMSAWYGRYLWIYDLVTDPPRRSNGHGKRMVTFLKGWAKDHDCEMIALASGTDRDDAHRFYERLDMKKSSYVFTQAVSD